MNEGGSKRRTVYRAVGIGGVLIAAAIITLYTPWLGLFNLRVIVVKGNRHITGEEIARASGLKSGVPLARLPVHRAEKNLEELPWVKDARVTRNYPHTARIAITERVPIAALRTDSGTYLLIGDDGVITAEWTGATVPYIISDGIPVTDAAPGGRVQGREMLAALVALHAAGIGPDDFVAVDFSDPRGVVLRSSAGTEVLLGSADEVPDRIKELTALLPTLVIGDYRLIDLRFGGEAILVPRKVVNR